MKRHSSRGVLSGADSSGAGDENVGKTRETSSAAERDQDEEGKKNVAAAATGPSLDVALAGLFILLGLCGCFSILSYKSINMQFVVPLDSKAPLDRFSEGRAMNHILVLAGFSRQEGIPGQRDAKNYILDEINSMKARASPKIKVDIDESLVNGSFNLRILTHSLSFAYRNHPNVAVRVAAKDAPEDAAAVLFNAHYDAPLGSPGASDCASCVASLLETLRHIIDTEWVPPAPVIFLFNSAEELFCLASHGFITTHKWRASIGAAINVEASGACGPDIVVQSGPGSWPSRVYYESAVHPMGSSVAQDIFPLIPGDTDYRIFSQDFGDIPGLDIVWILKGTVYHTPYDLPEFIAPGALQARGDNLIAILKGFTAAPELKGSLARAEEQEARKGEPVEHRPVFFDIWAKWMIFYPHKVAVALHLLPLAIVFLAPGLTSTSASGLPTVRARVYYLVQGFMIQVAAVILGLAFPVGLAVLRLSVSSTALTWFSRPWIALFLFVPSSLAGLLIPRVIWTGALRGSGVKQETIDWGGHWGSVALEAVLSAILTLSGGAGYLEFTWAMVLIAAFSIFRAIQQLFGKQSLLALIGFLLSASLPMAYAIYVGGMLIQFIGEKAGMTGSVPLPIGFYVADVIMAALVGGVVVWSVGPALPVIATWIGKAQLVRLLLYISIGSAALSSRAFPYSYESPKRLVLQHSVHTADRSTVFGSILDFASVDANPNTLIWKNVPNIAEHLHLTEAQRAQDIDFSSSTFMALYPIATLLNRGTSVPVALSTDSLRRYPHLLVIGEEKEDNQMRRIHVEVDVGDLQDVWGAAMNITGPLSSWSFAEHTLPAPEITNGGPPSYICRLSGHTVEKTWRFWLEASSGLPLRIDLAVLDQQLETETEKIFVSFPKWVAVVAGTSYMSTYLV
ncbi:unnamed protein product [Calypogeia fissa]